MITIRLASMADRADLLRLALNFVAEGPYKGLTPSTPHLLALIEQTLILGSIHLAVSTTGGEHEALGMLALNVFTHPVTGQRTASEIAWWLEPAHRKGLLGLRLLAAAEAWAFADARVEVLQMIQPIDSALETLYRRRGYRPLETTWQKEAA